LLHSSGMSPSPPFDVRHERKLLRSLGHELWQTETSAAWHCRREARRLGEHPPAAPLLAVAHHADAVLKELPLLSEMHGLPVSGVGHAVGRLFSITRQVLLDRVLDAERSYRGTLWASATASTWSSC